MVYCNKVTPASSYLVNIFGIDEKIVRAGTTRSVGFFWILKAGISFNETCSLINCVQPSGLLAKNYRSVMFATSGYYNIQNLC